MLQQNQASGPQFNQICLSGLKLQDNQYKGHELQHEDF